MKGAVNLGMVALILGLIAIVVASAAFLGGIKVQVQQASPQYTPQPTEAGTKTVNIWDLMVRLYDSKSKAFVADANVYLLYEEPSDIYTVPSSGIIAAEYNVTGKAVFTAIDTNTEYFILATAPGYYNAGKSFTMPGEIPADYVDAKQPVVTDIYMDPKGTILGVQVPLTYRGSTADVAKLVYNADNDDYETQFSFVADTTGVVKYKKLLIELNTTNLGTATIDELKVKVGDQEFTFDNVTGNKTIKFDDVQTIDAGSTLPITMTVTGTGLDAVSGQLFTVTLYDVQEGSWSATVEGPA